MDEMSRFRAGVRRALGDRVEPGRRYPAELRRLAVSIFRHERESGGSLAATAAMLGIGAATLKRWTESAPAGFRPVEKVVSEAEEAITVTTATGLRIACPSVETAVRLVRALS